MLKRLSYILFFLLLSQSLWAQEVSFTASAPRVIRVGERFKLIYSVNKTGKNISIPSITDFSVLMGPSTTRSFSTQYVNGKITTTQEYTYSYILLAKKAGKFTIPPAQIIVNGNEFSSNSLTIEVIKDDQKSAQTKPQQSIRPGTQQQQQQQAVPVDSKNNFLTRIHLSKSNLYKGEHLVVTLKIYSVYPQIANLVIHPSSFDGFLSQEITKSQQNQFQRENYNGTIYNTAVLAKYVLFPQRSGTLTIDPFEIECIARDRISTGNFIDDFFGQNYRNIQVKAKSPSIKINVKNLPPGKPYNFSGGVGRFHVKSSISKDSVQANEAITLNVNISGNGNLKLLKPLAFNFPPDFEVYEPEKKQNIKNSTAGMSGSISYKYLIIPQYGGKYVIPPAGFSYFDPKSKTYKQLSTPKYEINVSKGKGISTEANITSYSKEDVKYLGSDIRFIKTGNLTIYSAGNLFFGSRIYYVALLIPFILFLSIIVVYRKMRKEGTNIARQKHKRANKIAKKRLLSAKQSLKMHDKKTFYDNVMDALWGYTSDKFNIPLSKLTKENVNGFFRKKKIDNQLTIDFMSILNHCEYAQYAPSENEEEMDKIYKQAIKVISRLEDEM